MTEHLTKGAMAASETFVQAITDLIITKNLKNIIETGSYLGEGTTRAIRSGMSGGELVYSIEVNPTYHKIAVRNNQDSGINFLNGLSVGKPQLPIDLSFDVPDHIFIDFEPHLRDKKYRQEVDFNVADNMLDYALFKMDFKPDLVILDSAGHMGMVEFTYLMKRVRGDFYLALDDTLHIKHYATMEFIRSQPKTYEVIFETTEKFGSAIIKVSIH